MAAATMINKKNYVSAAFIDAERKNIEVLLNMPHTEEKTLTPHVIEADPKNAEYKALMKLVSEDQLHEMTWATKTAESEAFLAMARQVVAEDIKAEAIVEPEVVLSKTQIYPTIVDTIFTNMENEDHLFALKLALFQIQEIRESTDTATKTALRKGKNKIEVLQHAFNLIGVRQTLHDDDSVMDPKKSDEKLKKEMANTDVTGPAGAGAGVKLEAAQERAISAAAKESKAAKEKI